MIRTKILTGLAAMLLVTASYSLAIAGAMHSGTVLEAATGGGYSYFHIDEGGKQFWIAGPASNAKKGDKVIFDEQIWMKNFTSKAINRTFDQILFVGGVGPETGAAAPAAAVAASPTAPAMAEAPGASAYPASASKQTIASLIANTAELAGKNIEVRGKVVKVSKNIMNHTWVHIEDGTFHEGVSKIIFRTRGGAPPVGEEVTAIGRLETDVDFGMGYFYEVIVEDSSFF